jgi:murein DD-endopeptidase MepM/ murein hydrolase activator NlpD
MENRKRTAKARGFPLPFFIVVLALCLPGDRASVDAEEAGAALPAFPVISRLGPGDTVFRQYQADVENARQRLFSRMRQGNAGNVPGGSAGTTVEGSGALAEALTIYEYSVKEEDLLALAARCTIPYSAIATLNRLSHQRGLSRGETLYLPSMPGLFIPEEPESDLELLLRSSRDGEDGFIITVRRGDRGERFLFIPGADLSPTERTFFLTGGFSFPLKNFRLTSSFGPRINPVTGNRGVHHGLDLAAPLGTEVYASRDGTVAETGEDPVYGKYVIIAHTENWTSLYGHLSEINTVLHRNVKSGTLIGKVGSTGQSTGPHLHFEIRQYGKAQNPDKLLFKRTQ